LLIADLSIADFRLKIEDLWKGSFSMADRYVKIAVG
jgi:hypothetical protein